MIYFKAIKLFCVVLATLVAIDGLWIGVIAKSIYKDQIGTLMRASPSIIAGLIVWAVIAIGSIIFVLPLAKNYGYGGQFLVGALFGLVVYGVYDFTNLAILEGWPLKISLIDWGWGMILNGIIAVLSVFLNQIF